MIPGAYRFTSYSDFSVSDGQNNDPVLECWSRSEYNQNIVIWQDLSFSRQWNMGVGNGNDS